MHQPRDREPDEPKPIVPDDPTKGLPLKPYIRGPSITTDVAPEGESLREVSPVAEGAPRRRGGWRITIVIED